MTNCEVIEFDECRAATNTALLDDSTFVGRTSASKYPKCLLDIVDELCAEMETRKEIAAKTPRNDVLLKLAEKSPPPAYWLDDEYDDDDL